MCKYTQKHWALFYARSERRKPFDCVRVGWGHIDNNLLESQ